MTAAQLGPAPGAAEAGGAVATVQGAMGAVQGCMRGRDGTFLQLRCDEKGFLAVCAFGLPGRTHQDDPGRGVLAALDIVDALARRGEVLANSAQVPVPSPYCVNSKLCML